MFDVIVCGAGPAGSVAATVLARGGARVLLLDRARFPRDKLCGDTINPGTRGDPAPARADWRRSRRRAARGRHDRDRRARRAGARARTAAARAGSRSCAATLDAALVRGAVDAGARVEEGVLVRGPLVDDDAPAARPRGRRSPARDGRDVRVPAPLVIAADGRRSRLALPLGLARHPRRPRRWAIGAYFDDVDRPHVVRRDARAPRPLSRHRARAARGRCANVCLVVAARGRCRPATIPRRLLLAGDRRRSGAARAVRRRADDGGRRSCSGRWRSTSPVPGAPGLLLAGDAAGFIDPMTGDGLRFAVRGGELAARGRARGARGPAGASPRPAGAPVAAASSPRSGASTARCAHSSIAA